LYRHWYISLYISAEKENFTSLQNTKVIKIYGIASGLQVTEISNLKWSIKDDNNNEIDTI